MMISRKSFRCFSLILLTAASIGSSIAQNYGQTFDICRVDSDCASSLSCSVIEGSVIRSCESGDSVCLCSPGSVFEFDICSASSACPDLERCASIEGVPRDICVSCSILADQARGSGIDIEFVDDGGSNCPSASPSSSIVPPIITPVPSSSPSTSSVPSLSKSSVPSPSKSSVPSPSKSSVPSPSSSSSPSIEVILPPPPITRTPSPVVSSSSRVSTSASFESPEPTTSAPVVSAFETPPSISLTMTPTPITTIEEMFTVTPIVPIETPLETLSESPMESPMEPPRESPPVGPEVPTETPFIMSYTPDVDMSEMVTPSETDMFDSDETPDPPRISFKTPEVSSTTTSTFEASAVPDGPEASAPPSGSMSDGPEASTPPSGSMPSTEGNTLSPDNPSNSVEAEGENDGACVDASLLTGIAQKDRVFSSDRRASVLCDESGTCATSGHMVVWKERPMSMQQYCSVGATACTTQVRWVNSPRYSRGLRLPSRTDGLQLTPLAAKWNTKGERIVLGLAVRIGL